MKEVYRVRGTQVIEIYKYVKASSPEEALEIVESMDIGLIDYVNDTIGCDSEATEVSEGCGYIEWRDVEESPDHEYDSSTDRYKYEIWFEGNMIHDSGDYEYENDLEPEIDAEEWITDYIEDNKDCEVDDFEIKVKEV